MKRTSAYIRRADSDAGNQLFINWLVLIMLILVLGFVPQARGLIGIALRLGGSALVALGDSVQDELSKHNEQGHNAQGSSPQPTTLDFLESGHRYPFQEAKFVSTTLETTQPITPLEATQQSSTSRGGFVWLIALVVLISPYALWRYSWVSGWRVGMRQAADETREVRGL